MAAPMDLKICWTGDRKLLQTQLLTALKLGYEAVAFEYVVEDLLKCDKNKRKRSNAEQQVVEIMKHCQILLPGPDFKEIMDKNHRLKQYSRFNTVIDTIDQTYKIQRSSEVQAFDLVAVTPTSEKTWQQACLTLDVDIISLDLTSKLPFHLKRQQINSAIDRGVFFEICYAPAIKDSTARRYIISNAQALVGVCKGKNVILSSGSEKPMDLRGPNDVANLGELFGLNKAQSIAATTINCQDAILHGQSRKRSNSIIAVKGPKDAAHASLENLPKVVKDADQISKLKESDTGPPNKKAKQL